MSEVTIVICTYNRSNLLRFSLQSLTEQCTPADRFNVLIVDNNSTDNTPGVIKEYVSNYPNFYSVVEEKQGLSHARNRAITESKTEWLTYFDDDAKAFPDFVENILETIQKYDYHIIAGKINDWFLEERPNWYHDLHDSKKKDDVIQELGKDQFAIGCNMTVCKEVFKNVGEFDPELGMNGEHEFYGEEILIQVKARKQGFVIGFNPKIQIYHLVRPEKLSVQWHLHSNYLKGQSSIKTLDKTPPNIFIVILKALGFVLIKWPYFLLRLFFDRNFKVETFLIRALGPLYYLAGKFNYKK